METLVAVAHHRNQYCNRNKSRITDHFGSSPSKGFKVISCRTFQSGGSLLQSPPSKVFSFNSHLERKSSGSYSEPPKRSRRSKPIPINPPPDPKCATFTDDLSELWAGPAYSNSPPPSSLPIPKFSLRQKRSVSLDIPVPKSDITLQPMSKSAPSSPTRESTSPVNDFLLNNTTATENLRRILHLDITDD
ncbi:hypothetical protein BHE74_00008052 [Ensete ventricosum]|nr:hypothetical protein GW17_00028711 [Ensete ventricosum]RWW83436.1 hypothetical protein BHE74_00008052 [Ensete ventricosum]RZR89994.1 hypothetical protein BHM03_00017813 [Ensete ventricosum]